MAFTAINVVNGTTPANATWGNNAQTQYAEAINSFEQDLFTPFVLSGLVSTKDGSINNQLDVTAGVAFPLQSVDSSLRRRAPIASIGGQFTTSVINTTYYLFLNADGTFTWGTTSTGPANSLAICQATTDGSGNILVVTDKRTLGTTLLPGMAGLLTPPPLTNIQLGPAVGSSYSKIDYEAPLMVFRTAQSGAAQAFVWQDWTGSAGNNTWGVGSAAAGVAGSYIDDGGKLTLAGAVNKVAGQATAGTFGVPPIIASAKDLAVAVNTSVTVCTITTPNDGKNHLVRFGGGVTVGAGATNNGVCAFQFNYPDPNLGGSSQVAPYWNGTNVVGLSAITVVKGGIGVSTTPTEYLCGPNGTASVSYQNTAAGTISDKVSGVIELLT